MNGNGNYAIIINGKGPYHRHGEPADANRAAARLVDELKAAGHEIQSALFQTGADFSQAENLVDGESVYAGLFEAPSQPAAAPVAAPAVQPPAPAVDVDAEPPPIADGGTGAPVDVPRNSAPPTKS